jgi:glycosyltransferase involved in cell wall biosynthesis
MRLLVISYHYPSNGEVGGLRWTGLTKYLARHGWDTWYLTAAPLSAANASPGVTVESVAPGRTASELYRRVRRVAPVPLPPHRADLSENGNGKGLRVLLRPLRALRSEASGLLYMLSEGEGWTLRAARRARALIDEVRADVVVSSGPPHMAHIAAWLATRGKHVRWFVDLRDPWAGPHAKAWQEHFERSRVADAITRSAERLVFRSAAGVFTTTKELAAALTARYPDVSVRWVPNGADAELLPERSAQPFRGLGIAHLGTLYGGRDPAPVLRALRLFFDRFPEARRDGTMFRHAGPEEPAHAAATRRVIEELDLGEHVTMQRPLPRAAALDLLARSGLAIVLAQDQNYQVPSKLYESVVMGVPTLVVAGRKSATAREGERVGAFVAGPEEVEVIAGIFEQLRNVVPAPNSAARAVCDYRTLAPTVARVLHDGESVA